MVLGGGGGLKPYFHQDGITIYHGDCFDVLPEIHGADLLILDPPFNLGKSYGDGTDDNKPEDEYWTWYCEVLKTTWESLADDALGYLFHSDKGVYEAKPLALSTGWAYIQTLIWYGPNGFRGYTAANKSAAWSYLHEPILYLSKGNGVDARAKPAWFGSVIPVPRPQSNFREGRVHVAQKPLGLLRRLINFQEATFILDPFMGSGTTLRAAKDLGQKAIGIEIEERYCEIAAKRMEQQVLTPEVATQEGLL